MRSKVYIVEVEIEKYFPQYYDKPFKKTIMERTYYGDEVSYVVKFNYYEESFAPPNVVKQRVKFALKTDLNKVDAEFLTKDAVRSSLDVDVDDCTPKSVINAFVNKLVEMIIAHEFIELPELYLQLVKFSLLMHCAYNTLGHKAEIYDSGGSFPRRELKYVYYG